METMETPIIPDIMYTVGELPAMENIITIAALPRPIGRYTIAELKSRLAGSPSTGGSASSTSPVGRAGPATRCDRLTITMLISLTPWLAAARFSKAM
ncbi:hypothetical protein GCM10018954_077660 [Kutzneria kofuensis]